MFKNTNYKQQSYTRKREKKDLKQSYVFSDPISARCKVFPSNVFFAEILKTFSGAETQKIVAGILKFCETVPPQGIYMHICYNI